MDPRPMVIFCLLVNLVIIVDELYVMIAIKAAVIVFLLAASFRQQRKLLVFGLIVDSAVALILGILAFWAKTSMDDLLSAYFNWTIVALAGLLLFGAVGIENLLRVLFWIKLPRPFIFPVGFAIRCVPLVQQEAQQVRRDIAAVRSLKQTRLGLRRWFCFLEVLLLRSVSRLDHIVSQIERRGFSPIIFGRLPKFSPNSIDIIIISTSLLIVVTILWDIIH